MYERTYGARYDEAKDLPVRDIAKLIRRDIKAAQTAGDLPQRAKFSVRISRGVYYSAKGAIYVQIRDWPQAWTVCEGIVPGSESADGRIASACRSVAYGGHAPHRTESAQARAARRTVEAIAAAYNHDGSDIMTDYFDVHFYFSVSIEDEWQAARREATRQIAAANAAPMAARGGR